MFWIFGFVCLLSVFVSDAAMAQVRSYKTTPKRGGPFYIDLFGRDDASSEKKKKKPCTPFVYTEFENQEGIEFRISNCLGMYEVGSVFVCDVNNSCIQVSFEKRPEEATYSSCEVFFRDIESAIDEAFTQSNESNFYLSFHMNHIENHQSVELKRDLNLNYIE